MRKNATVPVRSLNPGLLWLLLGLLPACASLDTPESEVQATAVAKSKTPKRLEDTWGAGQTVGLLTGTIGSKHKNFFLNIPTASWYVRNEERKGMALLGGALAYDMVTTQRKDGKVVSRKLTSHGLLGIAGHLETRAFDGSGEYRKSHWVFPFYRYVNENGKRKVYGLFMFPITLKDDPQPTHLAYDHPPWDDYKEATLHPAKVTPSPPSKRPEPMVLPPPKPRQSELAAHRMSPSAAQKSQPSGKSQDVAKGTWSPQKQPHEKTTPVAKKAPSQPRTLAQLELPREALRTYTVQQGDTLYGIARHTYGRGTEWKKIFRANRAQLGNPDQIHEGMVLKLP